jgi:hypothetical protein
VEETPTGRALVLREVEIFGMVAVYEQRVLHSCTSAGSR